MVISALVEGNSVRATSRMTGVAKGTILKLLAEVGRACEEDQNEIFRNLNCRRIQCDEIWNFCYAKQKNVPADKQGRFGFGDVWTWVAIDADSKLIPTWAVGKRDAGTAYALIQDLAGRMANRIQLTTDGLRVYVDAVESAFGSNIDYSMLIKMYGGDSMLQEWPACILYVLPGSQGAPAMVVTDRAVFYHGHVKRGVRKWLSVFGLALIQISRQIPLRSRETHQDAARKSVRRYSR